jgi:anti-sigma factor RsiW
MDAHETGSERMTCQGAIALLADYLESVLGQERAAELDRHLAGCEPCRAYLNTYKRTRTLAAEAGRVAMPEEMKERVRQFLLRILAADS